MRRTATIIISVLLIATVAFIFGNSAQNGTASYKVSAEITEKVDTIISEMPSSELVLHEYTNILRKVAHLLEFALLGAELYALALIKKQRAFGTFSFVPMFFGLSICVADEYIQSFSKGRASLVSDIILDFFGILCGAAFALAVFGIICAVKKHTAKQH